MNGFIPRPGAPHTGGWRATLALRLERRGLRTVLASRSHSGPLNVQKPLYPEPDPAICHLTLLHPPGGLAGGDRLALDLALEAGSHAVVTTPGATKWYKSSPDYPARQDVRITLGRGARLDWLPLENIHFDHSEACLSLDLRMGEGATAIGCDAALLGRQASGETWRAGSLRALTRLRDAAGRLLWTERQVLQADAALRQAPQGLGGLPAYGTLWAVAPACDSALAQAWAPTLADRPAAPTQALHAGITSPVPGLLLVRAVADNIEPIRLLFNDLWLRLRPLVHGVPGRPLRLWAT
ncbi:urease accessory protein UreD [Achromobacter aloeverae]|uniref:Urease accessory protein UreD n=1 Tax=Achromobacter aloeverae TaxID=1750518 RepID=A0A4Q1HDV2_9BURK|nr:urease accessory protein UreD [Achromobacter aloeverae]RXN83964.1 urease accessory protein [Achromobacter aloeverae]